MSHNYASSLAYNLRKHLADEAEKANTWATEGGDGLHAASSYYVAPLAYYQHAMGQLSALFGVQLEQCVRRDGLTAEQVAEGLADHGVNTTADQLRATYPQIVGMERQNQWLSENAHKYLPLLFRVSRMLPALPGLIGDEYRWSAENTAGCVSAALADGGWDGTVAGLASVDTGLLTTLAPQAFPWLTQMTVGALPHGRIRDVVTELLDLVDEYYAAGHDERTPAHSLGVDLTEDPFDALGKAVVSAPRDEIELHTTQFAR